MSNRIPRPDNLDNILPEEVIVDIRHRTTKIADEAASVKATPTNHNLFGFYNRLGGMLTFLGQYAGNQKLIDFANASHHDAEYDVSVAFAKLLTAYTGYRSWYLNTVPVNNDIVFYEVDNGVVVKKVPDTTGLSYVLNEIIDTVE